MRLLTERLRAAIRDGEKLGEDELSEFFEEFRSSVAFCRREGFPERCREIIEMGWARFVDDDRDLLVEVVEFMLDEADSC